MIIGVDQGNYQIKTAHCVFNTSLSEFKTDPGIGEILEYRGKFYSIGTKRLPVQQDKTINDDFYILTLIAIAKELEARAAEDDSISLDGTIGVELSMGLPPGHYNRERAETFNRYFLKNKHVHFTYNGQPFNIEIKDAWTFIQSFAAIAAPRLHKKGETMEDSYLIVDIGGYTVDTIKVIDKKVQPDAMESYDSGIIVLIDQIKAMIKNKMLIQVSDKNIYDIFNHRKSFLPDDIISNVLEMKHRFEVNLLNEISESSDVDVRTVPVYFVGGGSKWFEEDFSANLPNAKFIDDVQANAKGYEAIYKAQHHKK